MWTYEPFFHNLNNMVNHTLVVSNPPQNGVNAAEVARHLGLTPEEFHGKVGYGVPEIWFADTDAGRVRQAGEVLQALGCKVTVMTSGDLLSVPRRVRVRSFSFTETGFVAHLDGSILTIAYDLPIVAIYCKPRETGPDLRTAGARRRTSGFMSFRDRIMEVGAGVESEAGDAEGAVPFLDIYVSSGTRPTRITVLQNAVDFSGLGHMEPRAASNMAALVENCEDRFNEATFDRRLEGMRLRLQRSRRGSGAEHRRGYSFASPALTELLSSISGDLPNLSQSEFSARLAFLTDRTVH